MSTAATRNRPPNEHSGFGVPETPTLVEVCRRDTCSRKPPLVTDLYCREHNIFLPLIASAVSVRGFIVISASLITYGFFEFAEQIRSPFPVYIIYTAIGLGFVLFPLRHFSRTATTASVLFIISCIAAVISRAIGTHAQIVTMAVLLIIGIAAFALYTLGDAVDTGVRVSRRQELRALAVVVAIVFIVAAGCLVASFALRLESSVLPGNENGIADVMLILAFALLALAVLILIISSLIVGVRYVRSDVRGIPVPDPPRSITLPGRTSVTRGNYRQNTPGGIIETFSRVIYQVLALMVDVGLAMARILANLLVRAAYEFVRLLINLLNLILRLIVLAARWVMSAAVTAVQVFRYAILIVWDSICFTVISFAIPVSALGITPWLLMAIADETLRYLRHGSLVLLRDLFALGLAAAALLVISFIILANQSLRESMRSFKDSAGPTFAYGSVVFVAGSWLLGIPGSLGHGHIHIGLLTISSTCLIAAAALLDIVTKRRAGPQSSSPSPEP